MNAQSHAFSQRDKRWAHMRIGEASLTIGEAGCLITAVASLLADWAVETDPARLNEWLSAHRGFVPPVNGGGACRFVFGAVEPLGARLRSWTDCYSSPANLKRLSRMLNAGSGALALVDARPGDDVQAHWVRLLEVRQRDCLIMDPWQPRGQEVGSLVARYGGKGWDAGRAIFVLVGYERVVAMRTARVDAAGITRTQPELCWRSGEM